MGEADPSPGLGNPVLSEGPLSEEALDALSRHHGIVLTPEWRASLAIGSRVAQAYARRVRQQTPSPS